MSGLLEIEPLSLCETSYEMPGSNGAANGGIGTSNGKVADKAKSSRIPQEVTDDEEPSDDDVDLETSALAFCQVEYSNRSESPKSDPLKIDFRERLAAEFVPPPSFMDFNMGNQTERMDFSLLDAAHQSKRFLDANNFGDHPCDVCGKIFKSKINLRQHLSVVHPQEHEACECPVCGKMFKSKIYLRRHTKFVHAIDGPLNECIFCRKQYKTRNCLQEHILQCHATKPSEAVAICTMCKHIFKTHLLLLEHMKQVHFNDKPKNVKCHLCNEKFESEKCVLDHMKMVHPNLVVSHVHACKFCGKNFKSKLDLEIHITDRHPDGDSFFQTRFKCKPQSLSDERTACYVCKKLFKTKWYLKVHIKNAHSDVIKGLEEKTKKEKVQKTWTPNGGQNGDAKLEAAEPAQPDASREKTESD